MTINTGAGEGRNLAVQSRRKRGQGRGSSEEPDELGQKTGQRSAGWRAAIGWMHGAPASKGLNLRHAASSDGSIVKVVRGVAASSPDLVPVV